MNLLEKIEQRIRDKYKHVFYSPSKNEIALTTDIEIWTDKNFKKYIWRWNVSRAQSWKKFKKMYPIYLGEL